ncbi:hypothetical protein E5163_08805 [Marinicauda algicola]|uniref:RHS repeat protein n=1 Tax=Marinicauda algicola TaxID=2029849 RepID=A0A4S2H0Y3_9PROT|nr:hypothetical protein [Marinicauda algicola]TGY89207.1 hypothetical protein E5163_08805 [Marinicauda algicola]
MLNSYDTSGRLIMEDMGHAGVTGKMRYEYDLNGNRTRIYWPDVNFFHARENGDTHPFPGSAGCLGTAPVRKAVEINLRGTGVRTRMRHPPLVRHKMVWVPNFPLRIVSAQVLIKAWSGSPRAAFRRISINERIDTSKK